jgi:hypothetical protein
MSAPASWPSQANMAQASRTASGIVGNFCGVLVSKGFQQVSSREGPSPSSPSRRDAPGSPEHDRITSDLDDHLRSFAQSQALPDRLRDYNLPLRRHRDQRHGDLTSGC